MAVDKGRGSAESPVVGSGLTVSRRVVLGSAAAGATAWAVGAGLPAAAEPRPGGEAVAQEAGAQVAPPAWMTRSWAQGEVIPIKHQFDDVETHDPARIMREMSDLGMDSVWQVVPFTFEAYWQSQVPGLPVADEARERDIIVENIAAAHENGLKYVAYMQPLRWGLAGRDTGADRPDDWFQLNSDGTVTREGYFSAASADYREFQKLVLVELATKYDIDGFWWDSFTITGQAGDYNPHMVAAFQNEYGESPPTTEDYDDPIWRAWKRFNLDMLSSVAREFNDAVKAVNPDVGVIINDWGRVFYTHLHDKMPISLADAADGVVAEIHSWQPNLALQNFPGLPNWQALFTSSAGSNAAWPVKKPAYSWSGAWSKANGLGAAGYSPVETDALALTSITNGLHLQVKGYVNPNLKRTLDRVRALEPWLTGASRVPYAAIVYSEATEYWYGTTDRRERYFKNLLGVYNALLEAHLPVEVITERELENDEADLSVYQVIVMPNTAALSDVAAQRVSQYVQGGGGLVATYETGGYDADGVQRSTNALADLIQFTVSGKLEDSNPGLLIQQPEAYHPSIPQTVRDTLDNYRVWPWGYDHEPGGNLPYAARKSGPSLLGTAVTPADAALTASQRLDGAGSNYDVMIARTAGQGRVVYFPLDVGKTYLQRRAPYLRQLLDGAVRWAAASPPPVEVDAPLVVQTTVFEKDGQLIVHLLNDISSFGRSDPNGDNNIEAVSREEVLPIHDITLTITGDATRRPLKAVAQPDGTRLRAKRTTITVPKLDLHTAVIVESVGRR